jgi:hypothetical protein
VADGVVVGAADPVGVGVGVVVTVTVVVGPGVGEVEVDVDGLGVGVGVGRWGGPALGRALAAELLDCRGRSAGERSPGNQLEAGDRQAGRDENRNAAKQHGAKPARQRAGLEAGTGNGGPDAVAAVAERGGVDRGPDRGGQAGDDGTDDSAGHPEAGTEGGRGRRRERAPDKLRGGQLDQFGPRLTRIAVLDVEDGWKWTGIRCAHVPRGRCVAWLRAGAHRFGADSVSGRSWFGRCRRPSFDVLRHDVPSRPVVPDGQ